MIKDKITIIVLTYNSNLNKTLLTLKSILNQNYGNKEIIIADDGSADTEWDRIENFLDENNFFDYKFVKNNINQGIVLNYLSGISIAEGEYVKAISPGDYLAGEDSLSLQIEYCKQNNKEVLLSKAFYYSYVDGKMRGIKTKQSPQRLLRAKSVKQIKKFILLYDDYCLGAAMFGRTETFKEYLNQIKGKCVFMEDNTMLRLMTYDNVSIGVMDRETILYEYSTGVSTNGNNEWSKHLTQDIIAADSILLSKLGNSNFDKNLKYVIKINDGSFYRTKASDKIKKCVVITGYLNDRLIKKFFTKHTNPNLPQEYIDLLDN